MALANTVVATYLDKLPSLTEFIDRTHTLPVYRDRVYAAPVFSYDDTLDVVVVDDGVPGNTSGYLAHGTPEKQVATRLGLPTALPEKLRNIGATDELAKIFNKAVMQNNRDFMMRTNPGNDMIFAALTPSYKRMDNHAILKPLLEQFQPEEWLAKEWSQNPSFSRFSLLHRDTIKTIDGKELIYGVTITNSEDGMGRLGISGLLMALLCSNGMIGIKMSRSQSIVHRGKRHRPGELDANNLDMDDVMTLVPTSENVLSASRQAMEKASLGMSYFPGFNKEEMILGVADYAGATFGERQVMLQASNSYDDSLWGYANIVNHVAHQQNAKRNHELESAAWDLLNKGIDNPGFINSLHHKGHEILKSLEN